MKLYAYVILENHIPIVAQSDDIGKSMAKCKKAHKSDREYQLWQEGIQPKLMQTDAMMISKIKYIHHNPVKRGWFVGG